MGDREIMSRIKAAVEELATFEYPRVWIGEEGITPEEYLRMEEINVEERRELWQKMTPEARIKVWEEIPKE